MNGAEQLEWANLLEAACRAIGMRITRPRMRSGNLGGYVEADYRAVIGWLKRGDYSFELIGEPAAKPEPAPPSVGYDPDVRVLPFRRPTEDQVDDGQATEPDDTP